MSAWSLHSPALNRCSLLIADPRLLHVAATRPHPLGGPRTLDIHRVTVTVNRRSVRTVHVFWITCCQLESARRVHTFLIASKFCLDRGGSTIEDGRGAFLCLDELQSVSL